MAILIPEDIILCDWKLDVSASVKSEKLYDKHAFYSNVLKHLFCSLPMHKMTSTDLARMLKDPRIRSVMRPAM